MRVCYDGFCVKCESFLLYFSRKEGSFCAVCISLHIRFFFRRTGSTAAILQINSAKAGGGTTSKQMLEKLVVEMTGVSASSKKNGMAVVELGRKNQAINHFWQGFFLCLCV